MFCNINLFAWFKLLKSDAVPTTSHDAGTSKTCDALSIKSKDLKETAKIKTSVMYKENVPYPARLPKLTEELLKIDKNGQTLEREKYFISFWASHLSEITNGGPTPKDYGNYAQTIVKMIYKLLC